MNLRRILLYLKLDAKSFISDLVLVGGYVHVGCYHHDAE